MQNKSMERSSCNMVAFRKTWKQRKPTFFRIVTTMKGSKMRLSRQWGQTLRSLRQESNLKKENTRKVMWNLQ